MKANDKIILYVDGQMNDDERAAFEKDLLNSSALRDELESYKKFLLSLKELKEVNPEEEYFIQMIPKLRGRIEERKKAKYIPKLALSFTTITAVTVVLIFSFLNKGVKKEIPVVPSSTSSQTGSNISVSFSLYPDQISLNNMTNDEIAGYDSVFNAMISNELNLSPQSLNYLSADNNSDVQSMLQGIDEKEANEIYNQLLHKKFF